MLPRLHLYFMLAAAVPLLQACGGSPSQAAPAPPPAPTVSIVSVTPETVPVSSEWVATLDGFVNAQIRPEVSGYLIATHFREGSVVRKGQVIFEIDARPFEAVVAQATAQLAQAQAELGRTERDVARDTPLAKDARLRRVSSTTTSRRLAAQAAVKSAEANLSTAKLNVGFTKVRSLIDGVAASPPRRSAIWSARRACSRRSRRSIRSALSSR